MERGCTERRLLRRPREPINEAESLVSHWLYLADTRFSGRFARKLREWNLIASEWAALREIYQSGRQSPVDLARAIGMSKGGASKLVSRLVKKGLVRKTVGRFDRRFRAVGLTRPGEDLVPHLAILERGADHRFFHKLPIKMRHRFLEALKLVACRKMQMYRRVPTGWDAATDYYTTGATPPLCAVASNAANSSGDNSRNLPRDR
jgi:DNA-binding MarR family transcriptional regulator